MYYLLLFKAENVPKNPTQFSMSKLSWTPFSAPIQNYITKKNKDYVLSFYKNHFYKLIMLKSEKNKNNPRVIRRLRS